MSLVFWGHLLGSLILDHHRQIRTINQRGFLTIPHMYVKASQSGLGRKVRCFHWLIGKHMLVQTGYHCCIGARPESIRIFPTILTLNQGTTATMFIL